MNILEKLKEQDTLIEDINNEINNILEEADLYDMFGRIMPLPIKVVKGIVDAAGDIIGGDLDIVDKWGNKIGTVEKDIAKVPDEIVDVEVDTDVSDKIDWEDPRLKKALEKFQKNQEWLAQQGHPSTAGPSLFSTITIDFRGKDILTVKIGSGKEIDQYIGGSMSFDVLTSKKTSQGYILNLYNDNKFRRDTSLLIYARDLSNKPQTNTAQLIAKNGKFIGTPKKISFSITSTK